MISNLKIQPTDLQKFARELLLQREAEVEARTIIARELNTSPVNITRWLNETQNISGPFVERIIQRYAKTDMKTLARLLTILADKPQVIQNLLTVESSDKEKVKKAVEDNLEAFASEIKD